MARNGSGGYTQPVADFVPGDVASAADVNSWLDDLGAEIANSIAADGQTPATATLPMGGFKHTNVAAAAARTDYARADQVLNSTLIWGGTAGGSTTAITIAPTIAPAAYAAGQFFLFLMGGSACGNAPTLNVSTLGAKNIYKKDSATALVSGDIPANAIVAVVYDGTQFQMVNVPQTLALAALSVPAVATGTGDATDTTGVGTIRGANATGTDKAGGQVLLKAGQGTGTGAGGAVTIQTAPAGSTGSSANALVTALNVDTAGAIQTGTASAAAGHTTAGSVTAPAARGARFKNTAKVWVKFNGNDAAIFDSWNVSSVTRNGAGDYTINFTNAMTDTNYCCLVSGGNNGTLASGNVVVGWAAVYGTSSVRVGTSNNTVDNNADANQVCVVVFGL